MYSNPNAPYLGISATALLVFLSGCNPAFLNPSNSSSPPVSSDPNSYSQEVAWLNLPSPLPPVADGDGGTRPAPFCLIAPVSSDETVSEMWSDRPLFVWSEKFLEPGDKGSVDQVIVIMPDSETVVWSQTITESNEPSSTAATSSLWTVEQIAYSGEALQPEQAYEWIVLDGLNRPIDSGLFQVMVSEERESIAADLAALEERLTAEGATAEAIAFEKANYLAERDLWSDAMQIAFSVENPSPSLIEFRDQIPAQLCETP